MRLVFVGAPGVGKGTQAKRLEQEFGWTVVATGDLLRTAIAHQTPLGQQAQGYIQRGELVPDSLVNDLVAERIQQLESFILDGYPRNVSQAETLATLIGNTLDAVVLFDLDEELLVERLGGRRVCPSCGAVYHVHANPSKAGDRCERCGALLTVRDDDKPETIRNRLRVFREQTEPLVAFYEARGLLRRVCANGTPEEVYQRLLSTLGRHPAP
ncbi:MAG: adenylate kinase [Fimbriimonadales bacterium]